MNGVLILDFADRFLGMNILAFSFLDKLLQRNLFTHLKFPFLMASLNMIQTVRILSASLF